MKNTFTNLRRYNCHTECSICINVWPFAWKPDKFTWSAYVSATGCTLLRALRTKLAITITCAAGFWEAAQFMTAALRKILWQSECHSNVLHIKSEALRPLEAVVFQPIYQRISAAIPTIHSLLTKSKSAWLRPKRNTGKAGSTLVKTGTKPVVTLTLCFIRVISDIVSLTRYYAF